MASPTNTSIFLVVEDSKFSAFAIDRLVKENNADAYYVDNKEDAINAILGRAFRYFKSNSAGRFDQKVTTNNEAPIRFTAVLLDNQIYRTSSEVPFSETVDGKEDGEKRDVVRAAVAIIEEVKAFLVSQNKDLNFVAPLIHHSSISGETKEELSKRGFREIVVKGPERTRSIIEKYARPKEA